MTWAKQFGIELLLKPHGILTDAVEDTSRILDALGNDKIVGVNLDTGNSWLGDGVVGIETVVKELKRIGFDGPTTLEVAGETAVKASALRLREWNTK